MYLKRLVLLVAAGSAAVMLTAAPSMAQTTKTPKSYPIDPITGYPVKRKVATRAPTRVTVSHRSYLDPGTASKGPEPAWSTFPGDSPVSIFYDPTATYLGYHNRDPLPNCLDLPGFCK
jgi:hypothetical protein